MVRRSHSLFYRAASVLALALLIAGCTKGGQFDPTEIFNSDVFDSKKKLKGERAPVFPEGVPGTATGVPAELVKGYEPPPEQPDTAAAATPPPAPAAEVEKPKPKPKPKAKVAAQKPPGAPAAAPGAPAGSASGPAPTRITVGPTQRPAATGQQPGEAQAAWPAPSSTSSQQPAQSSQSAWPAPPQTTTAQPAQSSQSVWPDPPAAGGSSR
jgi:outer membrane biosynthesis protein TonB